MKFQFFAISALNPEVGQEEVNRFCASHSLVSIEKQFVPAGQNSFWALCIQYVDHADRSSQTKKGKIDYREIFNDKDFAVYSKLRALRKTLADQEGIPVYSVFTNEQLATMVRERVITESAFHHIDGVGKARVEKYWTSFRPLLWQEFDGNNISETNEN